MRIQSPTLLAREHLVGHAHDIIAAGALPFEVVEDAASITVRLTHLGPDALAEQAHWEAFRRAWRDVEMARTTPAGVSGSCQGEVHAFCALPSCGCVCHPVRAARVMVDDLVQWALPKNASAQARRVFGGKQSCHLTVDGPLVVLHAFAERIGCKRAWYQDHPILKHYDLTAPRRAAALRAGAVHVSGMEQARERRRRREAAAASARAGRDLSEE